MQRAFIDYIHHSSQIELFVMHIHDEARYKSPSLLCSSSFLRGTTCARQNLVHYELKSQTLLGDDHLVPCCSRNATSCTRCGERSKSSRGERIFHSHPQFTTLVMPARAPL